MASPRVQYEEWRRFQRVRKGIAEPRLHLTRQQSRGATQSAGVRLGAGKKPQTGLGTRDLTADSFRSDSPGEQSVETSVGGRWPDHQYTGHFACRAHRRLLASDRCRSEETRGGSVSRGMAWHSET